MAEFGAELRRRREAAGLSLAGLAGRTHVSKGYLSKIENGLARASRSVAAACDRSLQAGGELLALVPTGAEPAGPPDPGPRLFGREAELDLLVAALRDPAGPAAVVVAGLGGIGKTALAVAAAGRAADSFPGGHPLLELGADPGADCLDRALRVLGVPGPRIPADPSGRAELLRDTVRRKPALLVIDDAVSAAQVRPLLEAGRTLRLLITSRRRLTALDDAEHLVLGPLPAEPARTVFRSISGCTAEDPVDELVELCASVPLALRIVAARVRDGGWTVAEMLDRLTNEASRIAAMDDGERSMAAVLGTTIGGLPDPERELLTLLGVHPGPAADLPASAAVAGLPALRTEVLLGRLYESCLLTRASGGLVTLHDLVRARLVSAEVPALPPALRDAALDRLTDHYSARVAAADALLEPGRYRPPMALPAVDPFAGAPEALRWLRTQWPAVVAVQDRARSAGRLESCWRLGFLLRGFFFREKLTEPWLRSGRLALAAAEEADDPIWIGRSLSGLGMAHLEAGDLTAAASSHQRAGPAFEAAGDDIGATDARSSLAWVRHYQGEHEQALDGFDAALVAYRRLGRPRSEGITLRGLALAAAALGRDEDAAEYARRAAAFVRTPLDEAMTLSCAAWVDACAGRAEQAATGYAAAAEVARGESPYELARALTGLGNVAAARGDAAAAARHWAEADEQPVVLDIAVAAEAATRRALSERHRD
ncbi:MAG TPA: helix-turn-helix domain-containing protein [Mycobacteriales bacterium]